MKKVPLRKCRRCAHYHGYCPLQDLEPCRFKERNPDRAADIFLVCVTITAAASCILFWYLLA